MKIASLNYSLLEKRWEKSESPIKPIVIGKTKIYCHYSDGLLKAFDYLGNEETIDFCADFKENNDEIIIYKGGNICCSGIKIQSNEHFSIDKRSIFVSRFFLNKCMFISFDKETYEEKCKSRLFSRITKTFFDNYIHILHENGISTIDKNLKEVFSDEDPSIIDFQANENYLITIHFLEENKFKIKIYNNFLLINSIEIEDTINNMFFGNENTVIMGNKMIIFDSSGKIKRENNGYDFAAIFTNENEEYLVASKNNELHFIHISTGILVKKEKFNSSISDNPIIKDKKLFINSNEGIHFFMEKQNVFE